MGYPGYGYAESAAIVPIGSQAPVKPSPIQQNNTEKVSICQWDPGALAPGLRNRVSLIKSRVGMPKMSQKPGFLLGARSGKGRSDML